MGRRRRTSPSQLRASAAWVARARAAGLKRLWVPGDWQKRLQAAERRAETAEQEVRRLRDQVVRLKQMLERERLPLWRKVFQ